MISSVYDFDNIWKVPESSPFYLSLLLECDLNRLPICAFPPQHGTDTLYLGIVLPGIEGQNDLKP